ncbi:UvrD-helicase domain-containing protein [Breoghania sp.]|uniref:ATP-dependent helicase n=1 Tax=Breoghania sp. TaxID=2065378 RepID=UPI002632A5B7|nr:UvrD-helicase domain-containing protein [Breoghania sp.]MDJ0931164.1 UvrD-helicase domain-containing protein [Breoghania sp.]
MSTSGGTHDDDLDGWDLPGPGRGSASGKALEPAPPRPGTGSIAARAMAAVRPAPEVVDYLSGLNPEQRDAVESLDGPLLVLAGAGTGKTRVLTTRIAHILAARRAFPSQILAVTFTNKAAREMKDRISSLVGESVEGMPWLGTFHSIGLKILRRHAEMVGLRPDFSILDTDDQICLIKQFFQVEGVDAKRWTPRWFAIKLDTWKNRGLLPEQVPVGDAEWFGPNKARKIYADYQERLRVINAADFGDLLLLTIRLFREQPEILKSFQERFRYMLVDEYQDTNIAQYLWLRLLAQGNKNICCVGDDDQSIYGWRGAEVDNILRFDHDFPGAEVIRLERNYRSTSHILVAASHLIAKNEGRLSKTLFTDHDDPDAELISVASVWDSEEEVRTIGEEIEDLQRHGHELNDIAILVRASFQMREFEDRFITLGLNYRMIGGSRFYERLEIRDALAYFRATLQPSDDLAFERIVNTPMRGLGDASLRQVRELARAQNIPMMQAAGMLVETEELRPKPRNTLKNLLMDFSRWRSQLESQRHTDLAEIILDESGYTEMWRNDRSADASGRLENLKELIRSMDEFESMAGFLEHISLVMDRDSGDTDDAVSIMTLHSAKGLEFDTVFLPGWEEGLFPHQRALDESGRAGLEEERRLAYVGITRAKKRARIRFTANRRVHGMWQTSIPSRFLDELPEEHVEVSEPSSSYGGYGTSGMGPYGGSRFDTRDPFASGNHSTPGWQRAQRNRESGASSGGFGKSSRGRGGPKTIEGELVAKSVTETESAYSVGERIFHLKFGYGRVASIDGNKLTIEFEKAGRKKVLDSFVEAV